MTTQTPGAISPATIAKSVHRPQCQPPPQPPQHAHAALIMRQTAHRYVTWTFAMDGDGVPAAIFSGHVDVSTMDIFVEGVNAFRLAAVHAMPQILDRVRELNVPVIDLSIVNPALRTMLRDLGDAIAPFHVLSGSQVNPTYPTLQTAVDYTVASFQGMLDAADHRDQDTPSRITIATNASLRARHAGAGCAWVRSDGVFHTMMVDTADIVEAELAAVVHAVKAHRSARVPIDVHCDSKSALALAHDALNGQITATSLPCKRLQRELMNLFHVPNVTLHHVKAHAGNPMNELADRLAVQQRRNHEAGVSDPVNARRLAGIVDEELGQVRYAA